MHPRVRVCNGLARPVGESMLARDIHRDMAKTKALGLRCSYAELRIACLRTHKNTSDVVNKLVSNNRRLKHG